MSRVVTASEVDRLHKQVAELTVQLAELTARVHKRENPEFNAELFMEDPGSPPAEGPRSQADSLVESITGSAP